MTSRRWVSSTDMLSIGLKPSRLTSLANISETQTAFMPKAGSRASSQGTSGRGPSPVMTSTSPMRSSSLATIVPWILI